MAQFKTDFSEYAVGSVPSDWTPIWVTTNQTWAIKSLSGALGGQVLEHTSTADARRLIEWNTVGTISGDFDILLKFRTTDSLSGNIPARVFAYASGSATQSTQQGYQLDTLFPSTIRIGRTSNGTYSTRVTNTALPFVIQPNTWYWYRFKKTGSLLQGKIWADGDAEPAAFDCEVTDTTLTSGAIGIGSYDFDGVRDYDFFSVGTAGDPAPPPTVATNHELTGSIAANSGTAGNLSVTTVHALSGSIAANSGAAAALGKNEAYSGSIAAVSTAAANLSVPHALTGAIAAQSGAAATILNKASALNGGISAASSTAAAITTNHGLGGSIGAVSVVQGVIGNVKGLTGDISALSDISASNLLKMLQISSFIEANSSVSGSVFKDHGLFGELQAVSNGAAALARIRQLQPGSINAVSNVAADSLPMIRGMSGAFSGLSSVTAELDLQGHVSLSGTISSQSSLTLNLSKAMQLSGGIAANAGAAAEISKLFNITGSLQAISSIGGSIAKLFRLEGSIAAVSSLMADITGTGSGLSGLIRAVSSLNGDFARSLGLRGGIEAVSDLLSELYVGGQVFALDGNITAISNLEVRPPVNTFLEVDDPGYDGVEAVNDGQRLSHTIDEGPGRHIEFHFEFIVDPNFLESIEFRVKGTPGEPFTLRAWNYGSNRWDTTNQAVYDGELDSFVSLIIRDFDNYLDANNRLQINMRSIEAFTSGTLTLSTDYAELRKSYFQ